MVLLIVMELKASVLIPAHNEASYLPTCLDAVVASDAVQGGVEVIVIANGCSDDTADIARGYEEEMLQKGWTLTVLDLAEGGKLNAWNKGEATAIGEVLIYPGNFDDKYQTDADGQNNTLGMVGVGHLSGVMILSKPALIGGFDNAGD